MVLPRVLPTALFSDSKTAELFSHARTQAHVKKKVEASLLVKLVQDVRNISEELSKTDLETIKDHKDFLLKILNKQNSKSLRKKYNLINDAYHSAEKKLSHSENVEKHKSRYQIITGKLDRLISETGERVDNLERNINSTIDKLSVNAKVKAKIIIETMSLEEFNAASDITKILFPPRTVIVQDRPTIPSDDNNSSGKTMPVKQPQPNIQEWVSLGPLVKEQLKFKADLESLMYLKSQSDTFSSAPMSQQENIDFLSWETKVFDIDKRYNKDPVE